MRKMLTLLLLGVFVLSSCKEEPSIILSQTTATVPAEGETLTIEVTSNCSWSAACNSSELTITPTTGTGNATVQVVVPENPVSAQKSYQNIVFTASNEVGVVTAEYSITQNSSESSITATPVAEISANGYAYQFKAKLTASNDWSASCENSKVTIEPSSGAYGETELTISIPENTTAEDQDIIINFSLTDNTSSYTLEVVQPAITSIEYGGVTYSVKWLADGRLWMTENLRYVPEGKTATTDLTAIDNGVWFPVDSAKKVLSDNAELVKQKGLLYNTEAALGLAPGTLNKDNYASYEGKQGICPEGWHIPTLEEQINLYGKSSLKDYFNAEAPYYDAEKTSGSIAKANEDGWNILNGGYVNVANASTKTGAILNVMTYMVGSSAYTTEMGYKESSLLNADGSIKNIQFFGTMIAKTYGGSISSAFANYRSGMVVRCIRDAK